MSSKITPEEIKQTFEGNKSIWPVSDKWHYYTKFRIHKFVNRLNQITDSSKSVINAGSAGENFGILESKTLHVDLVLDRIKNKPNHLEANIEKIPIEEDFADLIICVGSVINYSDLLRTISEFSRLTKPGGHLILEFELSNTLELLFTSNFNANAVIITTFYRGDTTKIWYYSEAWVINILLQHGFRVVLIDKWHYLSPLIFKLTKNSNFSYVFSKLDFIIKKIPLLNRYASNAILCAQKT